MPLLITQDILITGKDDYPILHERRRPADHLAIKQIQAAMPNLKTEDLLDGFANGDIVRVHITGADVKVKMEWFWGGHRKNEGR